jgi:hypothetical protein
MPTHPRRFARTLESVHCVILSISTFLAGLYFGPFIPEGANLILLQVGLVGLVCALGLANLSAVRHLKRIEVVQEGRVEQRLERHVTEFAGPEIEATLAACGTSA